MAGMDGGIQEAPAWPWLSFAGRWLLTPLFFGKDVRRCAARRCGLGAEGHRRYCPIHTDGVISYYASNPRSRLDAEARLERYSRGTRCRVYEWLESVVQGAGSINLVADGFEPEPYEEVCGIVTEPSEVVVGDFALGDNGPFPGAV